jgi:hypothetical protein
MKDSHSQREPSKAKSRSSFSLIHGPKANDIVAKSNSQGITSWKAACPVAINIHDPMTPPAAARNSLSPRCLRTDVSWCR